MNFPFLLMILSAPISTLSANAQSRNQTIRAEADLDGAFRGRLMVTFETVATYSSGFPDKVDDVQLTQFLLINTVGEALQITDVESASVRWVKDLFRGIEEENIVIHIQTKKRSGFPKNIFLFERSIDLSTPGYVRAWEPRWFVRFTNRSFNPARFSFADTSREIDMEGPLQITKGSHFTDVFSVSIEGQEHILNVARRKIKRIDVVPADVQPKITRPLADYDRVNVQAQFGSSTKVSAMFQVELNPGREYLASIALREFELKVDGIEFEISDIENAKVLRGRYGGNDTQIVQVKLRRKKLRSPHYLYFYLTDEGGHERWHARLSWRAAPVLRFEVGEMGDRLADLDFGNKLERGRFGAFDQSLRAGESRKIDVLCERLFE